MRQVLRARGPDDGAPDRARAQARGTSSAARGCAASSTGSISTPTASSSSPTTRPAACRRSSGRTRAWAACTSTPLLCEQMLGDGRPGCSSSTSRSPRRSSRSRPSRRLAGVAQRTTALWRAIADGVCTRRLPSAPGQLCDYCAFRAVLPRVRWGSGDGRGAAWPGHGDRAVAAARETPDSATIPTLRVVEDTCMPAEWARHERTLVAWPARRSLWGPHLDAAKATYADVIRAVARFEPVLVVANVGEGAEATTACTGTLFRQHQHPVEIVEEPIDDSWLRDNGPIVVVDGSGHRRPSTSASTCGVSGSGRSTRTPPWPARLLRPARASSPRGADRPRRRCDHGRWCRHADHHRAVPAEPEPQPGSPAGRSRPRCASALGVERVVWLERD